MLDVQTVTMVTEVRMMRTSKVWIEVSSLHFCLKGSRCKVNELLQQRIELYNIPDVQKLMSPDPSADVGGARSGPSVRQHVLLTWNAATSATRGMSLSHSWSSPGQMSSSHYWLPLSAEKCGQRVLCFSCSDNIYLRFATHGWVSCESLSTEANEVMKS